MAKKTVLGIDIGQDTLKLALCRGGQVRKLASAAMPKNLVKEGRIVSPESMGELLRKTMKENRIHASLASLALSNEASYVRTVTMPIMSAEQLELNIPYEFNDYITDELKNYVFDYAMISTPDDLRQARFGGIPGFGRGKKKEPPAQAPEAEAAGETEEEEEQSAPTMDVMVAAVRGEVLTEARETLRRAGLKLYRAAPSLCGFISLIRAHGGNGGYCILDLGFQSIRMYMFQGDRHVVTRVLETGLSVLDNVIADASNVDVHLAHTYLTTNYGDCQNQEYCINAYGNIAVELIRALNFYNFSNPDSNLSDVWICGGGAAIAPLRSAIAENLDLQIHPAAELIPGGTQSLEDGHNYLEAIGIAMDA
ncbi:MAG: pilus assembly protein PilM [Oscillibacter sp.]|nr:pilus assembly protein PilM [Oscillibacter sp.]